MVTDDRPLHVLMVEDSEVDALLIARALRRGGYGVTYRRVDGADAMTQALREESFDLVLSDYALPGFGLWQAMEIFRAHRCDVPFIVTSGVIGEDTAVEAMRVGAHDYVHKDDLRRLEPAVARELREAELRRAKHAADRAKHQSDAMLQQVMDGVPVMLAYVDRSLRYQSVNREYASWFGASPEELASRSVRTAVGQRLFDAIEPDLRKALGGDDVDRETHVESPTRGPCWLRMRYRPNVGADGEVDGVFIVGSDVSEQLRACQELAAREAEVRTILDSTADGILVIRRSGEIQSFNPAAERIFGYTADEAVGTSIDLLMPGTSPRDYADFGEPTKRPGDHSDVGTEREVMGRRKNGESFPMALRISRRVGGRDDDHTLIATVHDITERKRLEAERASVLERRQHTERLEALGTFAGGIAHDLNNVLAPILMYSAVLEANNLDGDGQRRALENIRTAAGRATELVAQIVKFASGEQGDRAPVELASIVHEVVDAQSAIRSEHVEIACETTRGLWVEGNDAELHQCVLNLVVNAAQALPRGGTVTVRVRAERDPEPGKPPELLPGGYHVIEVADTGEGIAPEIVHRIFDPFFSTKRSRKGTGLGLAIVHGIVRSLGGAIAVDSEVGVGSCFRIYLPAARAPKDRMGATELGPMSVLFVDDEAAICDAATTLLRASGVRTAAFRSARRALDCFAATPHSFDLAIVDDRMPDLTGVELIERLHSIRPDLPVLLGTARWTPGLEIQAARLDRTLLLRKPYTATDLTSAIRSALSPRS